MRSMRCQNRKEIPRSSAPAQAAAQRLAPHVGFTPRRWRPVCHQRATRSMRTQRCLEARVRKGELCRPAATRSIAMKYSTVSENYQGLCCDSIAHQPSG